MARNLKEIRGGDLVCNPRTGFEGVVTGIESSSQLYDHNILFKVRSGSHTKFFRENELVHLGKIRIFFKRLFCKHDFVIINSVAPVDTVFCSKCSLSRDHYKNITP